MVCRDSPPEKYQRERTVFTLVPVAAGRLPLDRELPLKKKSEPACFVVVLVVPRRKKTEVLHTACEEGSMMFSASGGGDAQVAPSPARTVGGGVVGKSCRN